MVEYMVTRSIAPNGKWLREVRATENKKSNNKLNFKRMENNQRIYSTPHLAKPVLCDGFLIPMTDFVLKLTEQDEYSAIEILDRFADISRYAMFLKQPLKLEMFVPCDEDGNVLEYFPIHRFADNPEKYRRYKKAKEKVLFENLSYKFGFVGLTDSKGNFSSLFDLDFKPNGIIEDLLKEKYKFSFTAFALERIFCKTGA